MATSIVLLIHEMQQINASSKHLLVTVVTSYYLFNGAEPLAATGSLGWSLHCGITPVTWQTVSGSFIYFLGTHLRPIEGIITHLTN